jgi:two-component system OmpR family sensor kinase
VTRLPIRARLTVVFVAVMSVVLVVIGSFLYYRTKHNLDSSIGQALRTREGAIGAYAASAPARSPIPPGERFAQLLTPEGRVIASRPDGAAPLLSPAQATSAARRRRTFELHERARYLAGPARLRGRRIVAVAGASLADRERALEGLGGALLIGGPLALLLAAAIAYATAAAALTPVDQLRRRAATISRADLGAQLPVPAVEDELRRLSETLNEMLERIARSASHERRFVADASHELRTPLAALRAELELAERHGKSAGDFKAAIVRSQGDVTRLIALSDGLLELAGVDESARRTTESVDVDVDELLQDIAAGVRQRSSVLQRIVDVQPSGLTVRADEAALRRAIANLFDNALLHGTGTVTAGADPLAHPEGVEIWVRDRGTLDPTLGDTAHDRFTRGPGTLGRPGAGLGLALVKAVAEAHSGSTSLAADPQGGVRATLRIPTRGQEERR